MFSLTKEFEILQRKYNHTEGMVSASLEGHQLQKDKSRERGLNLLKRALKRMHAQQMSAPFEAMHRKYRDRVVHMWENRVVQLQLEIDAMQNKLAAKGLGFRV